METVLIGASVALVAYVVYRLFRPPQNDFDRKYDEILNSEKYKVKGQYE